MRKQILLICLLLTASSAYGRTPHYIGLFADTDHSVTCISSEAEVYPFDLYVMVYPGYMGQNGVYFSITWPENVILGTVHSNDSIIRDAIIEKTGLPLSLASIL